MNPILDAAREVQSACTGAGLRFCFIGGLAVQRWGEPRLTNDVDLTLLTGFGNEALFVDQLLKMLPGRIPNAKEFALQNRVVLLVAANGVPVDVSLGAMPFEERTIERATPYSFSEGGALMTCSAEDLVVHKAFAGRDKDWLDIRGIVLRQGLALHLDTVWSELRPLLELKDDVGTEARLRGLVSELHPLTRL